MIIIGTPESVSSQRMDVVQEAVAIFSRPGISYAKRSCLTFLLVKMRIDRTYLPPEIDGIVDLESEVYLAKAAELILEEFPEEAAESFRLLVRTLNAHRLT